MSSAYSWFSVLPMDDISSSWSLDGLTAVGTESFHCISPNWISIGSVENCTVGCIETGIWEIADGIRRLDEDGGIDIFFWLLSKVNDWVEPSTNSYSSINEDVIGGIFSFDCFDGTDISLGRGVSNGGFGLWVGLVRAE